MKKLHIFGITLILALGIGLASCGGQKSTAEQNNIDQYGICLDQEVDLGLSVKWAAWNVGATSPDGYGDYYAWGEVDGKKNYSTGSYKYYNAGKYEVIGNLSSSVHDAATFRWGGNWRIPSRDEFDELINKCTWEWFIYKGVNGYKVTGPNGNSIFLPAAGYKHGTTHDNPEAYGVYWTSTSYNADQGYAWNVFFSNSGHGLYNSGRTNGMTIRPVR
ncbi:MAG: DUF1566 domain-containing protein [Muribaculaceae bacterium]|nr:DUF1566 domain-containing protein [Muribaculaceae bacterium]